MGLHVLYATTLATCCVQVMRATSKLKQICSHQKEATSNHTLKAEKKRRRKLEKNFKQEKKKNNAKKPRV